MMHGPPPSRRLQASLRRYRALMVALAVMLLAVLPHATFAASMLHGSGPSIAAGGMTRQAHARAHSGAHDHSGAHTSAAPCHEQGDGTQHAAPLKPPCCIIGCGVIGFGPQIALPRVVAIGHRLPPPPALVGKGAMIEPAERPPRPS